MHWKKVFLIGLFGIQVACSSTPNRVCRGYYPECQGSSLERVCHMTDEGCELCYCEYKGVDAPGKVKY